MNRKKRLIKIVASSGIFPTRTAAELAIRAGRIFIDGKPLKNPQFQLDDRKVKITFEGKPVFEPKEKLYFAFNKPAGYTCEKNEEHNVYSFLRRAGVKKEMENTLSAVGRLDKETTGLLIFTNDGDFAHRLLKPESGIEKKYRAIIQGKLTFEELKQLKEGVEIEVGNEMYKTKPARVHVNKEDEKTSDITLVLKEGKKRQIRKMLEAVKHPVSDLKRAKFGKLELGDLREGQFNQIRKEDIV